MKENIQVNEKFIKKKRSNTIDNPHVGEKSDSKFNSNTSVSTDRLLLKQTCYNNMENYIAAGGISTSFFFMRILYNQFWFNHNENNHKLSLNLL